MKEGRRLTNGKYDERKNVVPFGGVYPATLMGAQLEHGCRYLVEGRLGGWVLVADAAAGRSSNMLERLINQLCNWCSAETPAGPCDGSIDRLVPLL